MKYARPDIAGAGKLASGFALHVLAHQRQSELVGEKLIIGEFSIVPG